MSLRSFDFVPPRIQHFERPVRQRRLNAEATQAIALGGFAEGACCQPITASHRREVVSRYLDIEDVDLALIEPELISELGVERDDYALSALNRPGNVGGSILSRTGASNIPGAVHDDLVGRFEPRSEVERAVSRLEQARDSFAKIKDVSTDAASLLFGIESVTYHALDIAEALPVG